MPTDSEILTEAQRLIESEDTWCQHTFARKPKKEGSKKLTECGALDPFACQWCASGAITRACENVLGRNVDRWPSTKSCTAILGRAALDLHPDEGWSPVVFEMNDYLEHDGVVKVFDRAIEIAKEREIA